MLIDLHLGIHELLSEDIKVLVGVGEELGCRNGFKTLLHKDNLLLLA